MKLTITNTIQIDVSDEDELRICLRNIPTLQNQLGCSSASSKVIESKETIHLQSACDAEKETIINALNIFENNKTKAAEFLGWTRATLYSKIKQYEL
jgi:DNA-binding NtrC family response regulator